MRYNSGALEESPLMAVAAKKRYQNTTVRMPKHVYERAKTAISRSQASSFNEFVVQAIEEKVRRMTEAEIDAAFAGMARDSDYQRESIAMANEFEKSDWESFRYTESNEPAKTRSSKTRSR
jgi:hypothetical protein